MLPIILPEEEKKLKTLKIEAKHTRKDLMW